jgi:hypothetical protein
MGPRWRALPEVRRQRLDGWTVPPTKDRSAAGTSLSAYPRRGCASAGNRSWLACGCCTSNYKENLWTSLTP